MLIPEAFLIRPWDVRALINLRDLGRFQVFLKLLTGRIGQVANLTSLSNDVGVSVTTIKNWFSVLEASYVIFHLPPFYQNIRKMAIKSPKIYFTDVGFAAFLLGIHSEDQAFRDPLRGSQCPYPQSPPCGRPVGDIGFPLIRARSALDTRHNSCNPFSYFPSAYFKQIWNFS